MAMRSRACVENSAKRSPRSRTWDLHCWKLGVSREARVTYLRKSSQPEEREMWDRPARRYRVVVVVVVAVVVSSEDEGGG